MYGMAARPTCLKGEGEGELGYLCAGHSVQLSGSAGHLVLLTSSFSYLNFQSALLFKSVFLDLNSSG